MFTKEIKPVISEQDYNDLRNLYHFTLADYMGINGLSRLFIKKARQHYSVKDLAVFLGVSRRHLYRLLVQKTITDKLERISYLVYYLFSSEDYTHFIRLARNNGIIVSKGD